MRKCLTLLVALTASLAADSRAQYNCRVTMPGDYGPTKINGYGILTGSGNNFIVAADEIRDSTSVRHLIFLRSTDGGYTWRVERPPLATDTGTINVQLDMVDSLTIFACGYVGLDSRLPFLLRTTNAGATWQQLPVPFSGVPTFGGMSFASANEGIYLEERQGALSGCCTTTDGGQHWKAVPFLRVNMWNAHAFGNGRYALFESDPAILYTTSDNWAHVDSSRPVVSDLPLTHILLWCDFSSGDTMLVTGWHTVDTATPFISRTTDAGKHWTTVYDDTVGKPGYAFFSSSDISRDTIVVGLLACQNSVLRSTDRGATWAFDTLLIRDDRYSNADDNFGIGINTRGELVGAFSPHSGDPNGFLVVGRAASASVAADVRMTQLQLYPNPVQSSLRVSGAQAGSVVRILDLLGREMLSPIVPMSGALTIDVTSLEAGCYVLSDGTSSVPFVKE